MMQRCVVSGCLLWAIVGAQIVFPDTNNDRNNGFDPCRLCPCNGGTSNIACPASCCNYINRPISNTQGPNVNRPNICPVGCFQCFSPGQGQVSCGTGCCRNNFIQPTVAPVQPTCPAGCFRCNNQLFSGQEAPCFSGNGCCRRVQPTIAPVQPTCPAGCFRCNQFFSGQEAPCFSGNGCCRRVQAPTVTAAPTCPASCFSCNIPTPGLQTSCGQQGCCRNIVQTTLAPNQCSSSCTPCNTPTIVDQITCGFTCCIKSQLGPDVNQVFGGKEYHFSWLHDGNQKYTQQRAVNYCASLPGGWRIIAIETRGEDNFVSNIITTNRLDYIWTGGTRTGSGWRWLSGASFQPLSWSTTGGSGIPQPDNREPGGENCLAVLNNFYNDGVKWHDIGCHHLKPTICER